MSSLLGDLPPLHGRRTHTTTKPARPVTPPSASPPLSSRSSIRPLRLALRFSPPTVAIEYEHLASRQRRCKECRLDNTDCTRDRQTHCSGARSESYVGRHTLQQVLTSYSCSHCVLCQRMSSSERRRHRATVAANLSASPQPQQHITPAGNAAHSTHVVSSTATPTLHTLTSRSFSLAAASTCCASAIVADNSAVF